MRARSEADLVAALRAKHEEVRQLTADLARAARERDELVALLVECDRGPTWIARQLDGMSPQAVDRLFKRYNNRKEAS